MNTDTYRKLLADIQRELDENDSDLRKTADRYDELMVERRKLLKGYYGIKEELEREGAD
jgi:preprotein translocase subunit SecA